MLCIRCGKKMPITCKELAYISMDGNPYGYMPLCNECHKAFINFINNRWMIDRIDNAPTVEGEIEILTKEAYSDLCLRASRERPKGEWIDYSEEGYLECPICGYLTTCGGNKEELHYCWHCGANMRGEENG